MGRKNKIVTEGRIVKYVLNKAKGLSKRQASIQAGFADSNHTTEIERSKVYEEVHKTYFRDVLLQKISMQQVSDALVDNITQENEKRIDRGARNKAIEIAKDWIEPETSVKDDDDKVLVILR